MTIMMQIMKIQFFFKTFKIPEKEDLIVKIDKIIPIAIVIIFIALIA